MFAPRVRGDAVMAAVVLICVLMVFAIGVATWTGITYFGKRR